MLTALTSLFSNRFSQTSLPIERVTPSLLPFSEEIGRKLEKAIKSRNFDETKKIIARLELKSVPEEGSQFLISSIPFPEIFQFLLQFGFNPHKTSTLSNRTAYDCAAKLKLVNYLQWIFEYDEQHAFSNEYSDPLESIFSEKIESLAKTKFNIDTDLDNLTICIKYFKSVDPNYSLYSALYSAILYNNVETVTACLNLGINPAELSHTGGNIVYVTFERGNPVIIEMIVKAFQQHNPLKDIFLEFYDRWSPLIGAINSKNTAAISHLLSLIKDGCLPYCIEAIQACLKHGYCEMTELFTTKIDFSTLFFTNGLDPLGYAVAHNQKKIISFLLRKQFNPNRVMPNGYTPIEYAVLLKKDGLVSSMVQENLNVNTSRDFSLLPLNYIHVQLENDHSRIKSAQKEILQFIRTNDLLPDQPEQEFKHSMANLGCLDWYPSGRNATLLQTAVKYGRTHIVEMFLSSGNKNHLQHLSWTNALVDAVNSNNFLLFCLIYEKLCEVYGAPVPFPNNGASPFSIAAENNRLDFIQYLLDKNPPKTKEEWDEYIIQAFKTKSPQVFETIAKKIDLKTFQLRGKDFIRFCIEIGRLDIVNSIFDKPFIREKTIRFLKGSTFLTTVVKEGHYDSLELLLDCGANIHCYTHGQLTPYAFILARKQEHLFNLLIFKHRQQEAVEYATPYLQSYKRSPEGTLVLDNTDTKLSTEVFAQILFLQKMKWVVNRSLQLVVKQQDILVSRVDLIDKPSLKAILILPEVIGKGAYGNVKKVIFLASAISKAQKMGNKAALINEVTKLKALHAFPFMNQLIGIQSAPDPDCELRVLNEKSWCQSSLSYRTTLYDGTIESKQSIGFLKQQPQVFVKIFKQLLTGLRTAHMKKIVHKDLKPDNIFILFIKNIQGHISDMDACIGDWGFSRLVHDKEQYFNRIIGYYSQTDIDQAQQLFKKNETVETKKALADINMKLDLYALGISLKQIFFQVFPPPVLEQQPLLPAVALSSESFATINHLIEMMIVPDYKKRLTAHQLLANPIFT